MTGPNSAADAVDAPTFVTGMRGYDRKQVDDYVAASTAEMTKLRKEHSEAQRKLRLATEHAEATERELREMRSRPAPAAAEEGFGFRAERLLRMAEQEAADVRDNASRESTAIVEKARTEAEQHRHEVEQGLIARASLMEQQAAQRASELADREQQIADQLAAAREQADELHTAAARAADRLRAESETAAEQTRVRAEQTAARVQEKAAQEVARLTGVQADVRSELGRLADLLGSELRGGNPPEPRSGTDENAPARRSRAAATSR